MLTSILVYIPIRNANAIFPQHKHFQEQLIEAANRDAYARQQQAAAAAHLQQAEPPRQASQWAQFIENQAMAAAQHNAAAAQHNAAQAQQHSAQQQHNAAAQAQQQQQAQAHRGFELPHNMASALQQQQQRAQLPHIHQQQQQENKRKRDGAFPYHQLFPIMAVSQGILKDFK